MTERQQRRLAAILAADIAGYSALMGTDEARTVRDLKGHQAVVLPMIAQFSGRIIDTAGDGILAEFGSVVNAVECAVWIQKTMAERNQEIDPRRQMQFRIGVNLGDVIYDDTRIYGDGINISARLESISEPGGICISEKVQQEVRGKIDVASTDLGPHALKNIAEPVRVYRLDIGSPVTTATLQHPATQRPALPLPDKPSIAVLPFTNMSSEKEQEYFSDGITEDIITELSRFGELFVIARNSSFQYKGKSPDIRQVGRELGVRYVLEGSIRRSSDRVRITGQLIDATSGAHIWADRYDRNLEDVFAVQEEVARTIVAILAAHVNKVEAERVLIKPRAAWIAYDYYLRANNSLARYFSTFCVEDLYEARRLAEQSNLADTNYARAYSLIAGTHLTGWMQALDGDYLQPVALDRALKIARKAVQLDPNLPMAHSQLGAVLTCKGQHEEAIAEFEKAMSLNIGSMDWRFAMALVRNGEPERAVEIAKAHMCKRRSNNPSVKRPNRSVAPE